MLRIADKTFDSHLFTGTGKFASSQLMVEAIRASGSQLVTLAMKRVDLRQHTLSMVHWEKRYHLCMVHLR